MFGKTYNETQADLDKYHTMHTEWAKMLFCLLLCDAGVAFDVLACTASILNLTAISVDR